MVTRDNRLTAGKVFSVDLVNRTIIVVSDGVRVAYDVPRTSDILLNGERVKMHVLQTMDPVLVTYGVSTNDRTALRIEVTSRHVDGMSR